MAAALLVPETGGKIEIEKAEKLFAAVKDYSPGDNTSSGFVPVEAVTAAGLKQSRWDIALENGLIDKMVVRGKPAYELPHLVIGAFRKNLETLMNPQTRDGTGLSADYNGPDLF